jgi:hypothetical protein
MTIAIRLDSIERKRSQLMDFVSGMDATLAAARPRPEKWSVQEIVEHLVLSEAGVFGNLDELGQRRPRSQGFKDRILYLVVIFILRFDIPVQVPSPEMRPRGDVPLSKLREQWESNHARLRAWTVSMEGPQLAQPLFVHPVAGPITTIEALRMLEVHLDRHTRQILNRGPGRPSGRHA